MTYKEHLIFVAIQRDAGDCFWLPVASVSWTEREIKRVVSLKGHPQDRFVYAGFKTFRDFAAAQPAK